MTKPPRGSAHSRTISRPAAEELWGVQALLQLVAFLVIAVLLWSALTDLRVHPSVSLDRPAALLQVSRFIDAEVLPRLNRAFEPDLELASLRLSGGVAAWALVSIMGNFVSALILFSMAATSWRRDRPFVKSSLVVVATLGVVLSVLATPLLYGVLRSSGGSHIPVDAAMVSCLIFIGHFVVHLLARLDRNDPSERHNLLVFIAAVDLPCMLATAVFIFCSLYVAFPAEFTVGVAAGLLTYSALAFLFLCGLFWIRTRSGEALMASLPGQATVAIAVGAALNGVIGLLVQLVKLPIYLDLVGSIFVALVYGRVAGILAAILGSILVGLLTTPITIAYVGTAVFVTAVAPYFKRFGYGTRFLPSLLCGGLALGPISSLLSIPITTYLFSGVTFTGSDIITALFRNALGTTLLTSVATGAFIFDAFDKALTSVMAYLLYSNAPRRLVDRSK